MRRVFRSYAEKRTLNRPTVCLQPCFQNYHFNFLSWQTNKQKSHSKSRPIPYMSYTGLLCLLILWEVNHKIFHNIYVFVYLRGTFSFKRVKWLLFKRAKSVIKTTLTKWKFLSKWVKSFQSEWNFTFWGSSLRDSSFFFPSVNSQKVKSTLSEWCLLFLEWFFTRFGMIFPHYESNFHSVKVVFSLFTLLRSNHFTLLTLREKLI